jgi:hypothetical protein
LKSAAACYERCLGKIGPEERREQQSKPITQDTRNQETKYDSNNQERK